MRDLLASIYVDAGHDATPSVDGAGCPAGGVAGIVVQASAEGLPFVAIQIPTSTDMAHHPLPVATQRGRNATMS